MLLPFSLEDESFEPPSLGVVIGSSVVDGKVLDEPVPALPLFAPLFLEVVPPLLDELLRPDELLLRPEDFFAAFLGADFFEADFLEADFLEAPFLAPFFGADFLEAPFFAALLLLAFLGAAFFAAFFTDLLAAFFGAAFFADFFFALAIV